MDSYTYCFIYNRNNPVSWSAANKLDWSLTANSSDCFIYFSKRSYVLFRKIQEYMCMLYTALWHFWLSRLAGELHNITESNIGRFYLCQSNLGRQPELLDPWFCMFYLCQATTVFGWGQCYAPILRSRVSWQYLASFLGSWTPVYVPRVSSGETNL